MLEIQKKTHILYSYLYRRRHDKLSYKIIKLRGGHFQWEERNVK